MTILIPDSDAVRKAAALAKDFERLARGEPPTNDDLAAAPIIDRWEIMLRLVPCLTGDIGGHPVLGRAPNGRTSPLLALDSEAGWARTWSRYYRLAREFSDSGRDQ